MLVKSWADCPEPFGRVMARHKTIRGSQGLHDEPFQGRLSFCARGKGNKKKKMQGLSPTVRHSWGPLSKPAAALARHQQTWNLKSCSGPSLPPCPARNENIKA